MNNKCNGRPSAAECTSKRAMALDFGESRIGVAVSIEDVGMPIGYINHRGYRHSLKGLIDERAPDLIIVGLPLSKTGGFTVSAEKATAFAEVVHRSFNVRVRMVDERLTTRAARSKLEMTEKDFKKVKDALSALEILNSYLENPVASIPVRSSFPYCKVDESCQRIPQNVLVWCPENVGVIDKLREMGAALIGVYSEDPQILLRVRRKKLTATNLAHEIAFEEFDAILLKRETPDPAGGAIEEIIRFTCS